MAISRKDKIMSKLKFGVLRGESRFSDLSPGIQSLFNPKAAKEILRKEAEEEVDIPDEIVEELLQEVLEEGNIEEIIEKKAASIFSENKDDGKSQEEIKEVLAKCLSTLIPGKFVEKGKRIKVDNE